MIKKIINILIKLIYKYNNMENNFEQIIESINDISQKLKEKQVNSRNEKKNYPLHILIEKSLMEKLKQEAKTNKISLAEYCRIKLRDNNQLDRIEDKLNRFIQKIFSS